MCFLRSKSGVADRSDGDVETSRSLLQGSGRCTSAVPAPQKLPSMEQAGNLETPTWVWATSDAAQYTRCPISDPHFNQRRNPQASGVGKSPVSCCNGNVLILLQLAFTEHSHRTAPGRISVILSRENCWLFLSHTCTRSDGEDSPVPSHTTSPLLPCCKERAVTLV